MKMKLALSALFIIGLMNGNARQIKPDKVKVKGGELTIQPIGHATMMISGQNKIIYVDPTGGSDAFKELGSPDIILITDIHGDHFDPKTLEGINASNVIMVVPQAVADKMPGNLQKKQLVILGNGDKTVQHGIEIKAIPMYNLPEAADSRHPKGRGNGYVLTLGGKNIYISGDTEAIPEMRTLKNIDIAFVCMNLPYTMDVEQAAAGVLDFKPKIVYPYHYRGQDINRFKTLVNNGDPAIEVRLRDWYGQ